MSDDAWLGRLRDAKDVVAMLCVDERMWINSHACRARFQAAPQR